MSKRIFVFIQVPNPTLIDGVYGDTEISCQRAIDEKFYLNVSVLQDQNVPDDVKAKLVTYSMIPMPNGFQPYVPPVDTGGGP